MVILTKLFALLSCENAVLNADKERQCFLGAIIRVMLLLCCDDLNRNY